MNKFLKLISVVAAFALLLVGCSSKTNSGASNSGNKTKIVTSVNFYAEVAKSIAGDKAEVSSDYIFYFGRSTRFRTNCSRC